MKLKSLMACGASTSGLIGALATAPHLLLEIAAGAVLLTVMVFLGIALPAVWSTQPTRRKAAAAVLGQILAVLRRP